MKSFKRVSVGQIPDAVAQTPEGKKIVRALNERLALLAKQANEAIESLVSGLGDYGQIIDVPIPDITGIPYPPGACGVDIPVPHHLGTVPNNYQILSVIPRLWTSADTAVDLFYPVWRSPTTWTASHIFLRAAQNMWGSRAIVRLLVSP